MNGDAWQTEQIASGVPVKLNGEAVGTANPDDTLGDTLRRFAQQQGIRSFIVLADGQKVDSGASGEKVGEVASETLEIYAKDTRG
jgi:hypothetical protein